MKKMLLIAGISVVAVLFIAYFLFTPEISIRIGRPVYSVAESYVCSPMVAYSERLGLPMPSYIKKQIIDFTECNNAVVTELHNNYDLPIRVDVAIELKDKQTIVTYSGTVTDKDGNTAPYEKQLVFDYIITKDIH